MAEAFDITPKLTAHLDRHMVLPLLEFLQEKGAFRSRDLQHAKVALVSGTKMVDLAEEEYKILHGEDAAVPESLGKARDQVYAQLSDWKEACAPLLEALADANLMAELSNVEGGLTAESLKARGVPCDEEMLGHLHRYAKLNFDVGRYRDAADLLASFRLLSRDEEARFTALWGKLAAEILMVNWEAARDDLVSLRDSIEAREHVDKLLQLQQRTWLIHWSLFIFFNVENGKAQLVDFLFEDTRLLNAVQMSAPHILRYLTAAVIIGARRKEMYKLVRIVEEEATQYSDPVTEFLVALYREFDFELAREKLAQCEGLLANDFFLNFSKDDFFERARALIFETTCRIHKNVDIGVLSERLDLGAGAGGEDDKSSAEQKVIQLIRGSKMDARIDSDNNTVVVGTHYPAMYQQVIDSTRELTYRTQQLAITAEKRYASAPPPQ